MAFKSGRGLDSQGGLIKYEVCDLQNIGVLVVVGKFRSDQHSSASTASLRQNVRIVRAYSRQ
jgi:hypothetical protein